MRSRILSIVGAIVLIGVFALAARLNHTAKPPPPPAASPGDALKQYGFVLQDVTAQSKIAFTHTAPTLDPKLAAIMPRVADMGAAVSVVDFDRDGWPDIYVCDSGEGKPNHLYHNNHDGTFTDVAAQMGVADLNQPGTGASMGAVWGDFDNCGYPDLLVYKWGRPRLFHNDHGKRFVDVTDKAGLPKWVNANSATWMDYDCDGKLDLLICGYFPENLDLWHLTNTRMMPDSLEYARTGAARYLLHNNGDGTFTDVTAKMGINTRRWTLAVCAADLRGTGYPDLILANDYGKAEIYANDGGKGFHEIAEKAIYEGGKEGPKSGMNAAVGDVLNQGRYAIYVANITEPGNLTQYNNLWVPRTGTSGDAIKYDNLAADAGVGDGGWGFGAQFGDLNNDGFLDLVATNGYYSGAKNKDYWYDYSKVAGGNTAIIADAANWPPMNGASLSGFESKRVWVSDGFGKFREVAQAVGYTDTHDGRAVALADLFHTGALDIIVANQRGPLLIYKNTADPANAWLELNLQGTHGNRDAIGTQVEVFWKDAQGRPAHQLQQVAAASGFCAQNDHTLHFGLGKGAKFDHAVIHWPDNRPAQTLTTAPLNTITTVKEP